MTVTLTLRMVAIIDPLPNSATALIIIAFRQIPFLCIPGNIPVLKPEWLNSAGIHCPRNGNLAGPSAKFHSTGIRRNDQIPAGICGAR